MSGNKAQGFLDDILAHPDDDTPRLIFADWLDDEGDGERAEFIRGQIERAQLPKWDARQVRLRLRESELIKQHGEKWKQELPTIKGVEWGEFRRGFVASASIDTFQILQKNASACWAAAPIEVVSFAPWSREHNPIKTIAPIPGLRELILDDGWFEADEVERLADTPLLSTLRILNISNCNLSVEGFRQLASSPHLGNLTQLRLPDNYIGNGGIELFVHTDTLPSLAELDLSQSGGQGHYYEDPIIETIGLEALARWPGLARLRSLNLSGNSAGRSGLGALLQSKYLSGLKELILQENDGLDAEAMQEFGIAHSALQLDVLDLGLNVLRNGGAAALATAPCLRELKVLAIDRCEIHTAGAYELSGASFLGSLRLLNVDHNSFGPDGLRALLETKPQHLHTLGMVNNDLGDEGASHLAESPASDALLELDLRQNGLGRHGAHALGNSECLHNLLILRLTSNLISRSDAAALACSPVGKRLAVLEGAGDDVLPF